MAATAILNFRLMATTRSLLAIACIGTKFDPKIKISGISIDIIKSWFFIISELNWIANRCRPTSVVRQATCVTTATALAAAVLSLQAVKAKRRMAADRDRPSWIWNCCLQFHVLAPSFQRLAHLLLLLFWVSFVNIHQKGVMTKGVTRSRQK